MFGKIRVALARVHGTTIRYIEARRVQSNYRANLLKLRGKFHKAKITVGFLQQDVAKWKCQSVYDALVDSGWFEPEILVYFDATLRVDEDRRSKALLAAQAFYLQRGLQTRIVSSTADCDCDIIFYQQPWGIPPFLHASVLSKRALLFYVPYFVADSVCFRNHLDMSFFRLLFRHCLFNDFHKKLMEDHIDAVGSRRMYAGKIIATGHPMLDEFKALRTRIDGDGSIIYAPHWSISQPSTPQKFGGSFSTFHHNGWAILRFAEDHPELKWVFKPHPTLKKQLLLSGFFKQCDIDEYWRRWAAIAQVSVDSNYPELFDKSFCLITDCGSFLTEYAATGHPLIRLVFDDCSKEVNPLLNDLYNTYYVAHNLSEMYAIFENVIINRNDPLKSARLLEIERAGIGRLQAGTRVADYIDRLLSGNES